MLHAKTVLHNSQLRDERRARRRRGTAAFDTWLAAELSKYVDTQCGTCRQWYALASPPPHCPSLLAEATRHSAQPEKFARACHHAEECTWYEPLFRTADGLVDHPWGMYRELGTNRLVREFRPGALDPKCGHKWGCPCDGTSEAAQQHKRAYDDAQREDSIQQEAGARGVPVSQVRTERENAHMAAESAQKVQRAEGVPVCSYCRTTNDLEADDETPYPGNRRVYYCQACWAWWRARGE